MLTLPLCNGNATLPSTLISPQIHFMRALYSPLQANVVHWLSIGPTVVHFCPSRSGFNEQFLEVGRSVTSEWRHQVTHPRFSFNFDDFSEELAWPIRHVFGPMNGDYANREKSVHCAMGIWALTLLWRPRGCVIASCHDSSRPTWIYRYHVLFRC
jgi:hypothetical protein